MNKMRKGFTLVELLIVIVVIGILSAMMMLSSSEAVSSAKATAIVSNLRNLKTATLAWYNDSMDEIETNGIGHYGNGGNGTILKKTLVLKYLNGKNDISDSGDYTIQSDGNWTGLFVIYDIGDSNKKLTATERTRVKEKLAARAKSVGLINNMSPETAYDGSNNHVGMQIR